MLCGAPSWLSKAMVKGLPALALTAGVANWMSLATTVTASPVGLPAGAGPVAGGRRRARTGGQHGGQGDQAEGEGQALHVGGTPSCQVRGGRARRRRRRCRGGHEAGEGGELAADDVDRVAVMAGEVDGQGDDQRDLDGLGDVRGA